MKKTGFAFFLLICSGCLVYSQNNEVQLKDLKVPVAPAFSLLDFSPKIIESPGTIKAFTTNLVSNAALEAGLPKNFAFEFAPYWFFQHPNMNIYKYYGLGLLQTVADNGMPSYELVDKPNIFYGLRSTSISLGSVFKDSSKAMPIDINYIGYALRSTIINVRNARAGKELIRSIGEVNAALQNVLEAAIEKCSTLEGAARIDCIGSFISKSKDSVLRAERERFIDLLNVRPSFSVDVALASSTAFGNNNFSNRKTFRSGGWITLAYYRPLVSSKAVEKDIKALLDAKNYLNAYVLVRYLEENKTPDFAAFTHQKLLDFGGRLEFEFNRFSFSLETIRRINQDNEAQNTNRTVGIFQYKVNDNLFLLGTFGKDFGTINNLVSLFGLNWGFGDNSLNKPF